MDDDYNPEREAEAAMKLAAAADGLERQRWISLAMAWQELARVGHERNRPGRSTRRSQFRTLSRDVGSNGQ